MKTQHTPESWALCKYKVNIIEKQSKDHFCGDHICHFDCDINDNYEDDIQRIISCVNACQGINPEAVPNIIRIATDALPLIKLGAEELDMEYRDEAEELLKQLKTALAQAKEAS